MVESRSVNPNERSDRRGKFTPSELRNAKNVILSFAGDNLSLDHLGTVGFLGIEIGKELPQGQDKTIYPHELGATAYRDASVIFEDLKHNPTIKEGLQSGYVNPEVMDTMEQQIGERLSAFEDIEKAEQRKVMQEKYEETGGLTVVGWGPFRLPGEKKRMIKSRKYARVMMAIINGEPVTSEQLKLLRKK
ncbi:MAG: hypothetical protein H0W89_02930 [Candidatus Levybacteria bacterium]|nr:hypothetical protein [Candidatus Levybacteria bacterium]